MRVVRRAERAWGKGKRIVRNSSFFDSKRARSDAVDTFDRNSVTAIGGYSSASLFKLKTEFATTVNLSTIIPVEIQGRALSMKEQLSKVVPEPTKTEVALPLDTILDDFEVWRWGLCEENLALGEWYFGGPLRYLGVYVRREFADSRCVGERQWHIDIEDRNSIKLIVYLNDVDDKAGPFEYLDRQATRRAQVGLKYSSGFVADQRIATFADSREWNRVTGPPFTAALADTCNLFHRAKPPVTSDRYSMTFSYSTARPYQVLRQYLPNRRQARMLGQRLTARERAAAHVG